MKDQEYVSLEYWAEKTKHKLERFVLGVISDKHKEGSNSAIPDKQTMEEWNDWFYDF